MNIGSYKGAASLAAYEKWQDITSQNIAASSIAGYKKSEASFETVAANLAQTGGSDSDGAMPRVTSKVNFEQGQLNKTGSDLDFAIQGEGFFKVQRENGEMAYTRNGEFKLSPDHKVVTKQGLPVIGDRGPIVLNPGGGTITISSEGMIAQGGVPLVKLGVFAPQDVQKLQRLGNSMFVPSDPGERFSPVDNAEVVNGYLEGSNVSPMTGMVDLITISRAYEASQKAMQSDDGYMDKAIQILGNPQS